MSHSLGEFGLGGFSFWGREKGVFGKTDVGFFFLSSFTDLAHGYILSDNIVQRAIEMDRESFLIFP